MNLPLRLSAAAFDRAAQVMRQARPLERELFAFHFEKATAEKGMLEVRRFQNEDGGFFGLEADIGFPLSTVLSTCHALHLLQEVGAGADEPIVQRALDYLCESYDQHLHVWPIIPPHDNSQPHAPWWNYSDKFSTNFGGFVDNPRPDVLACLLAFPSGKTQRLIAQVTADTIEQLRRGTDKAEMNGLICYLRLYRAPNLPAALKTELDRVLPSAINVAVERDPKEWSGYKLRPLEVAPDADSHWRPMLAADVEHNLDYLIQNQNSDGSWDPFWNWGGAFPDAWESAKLKWRAVLTLANLRTLRSYGRIEL